MTGEMVRALERRGLGVGGSSSEDEGGAFTRFFLAFTGTGSSSDEEGGAGFGAGLGAGLGATLDALGLFGAPFGLPLFFATGSSTAAASSGSTMGTSSIILYYREYFLILLEVLKDDGEGHGVSVGVHGPSLHVNDLEPELTVFRGAGDLDAV